MKTVQAMKRLKTKYRILEQKCSSAGVTVALHGGRSISPLKNGKSHFNPQMEGELIMQ